jgi:DNA-directed RNA polymerase specialized sigma24 family protein
VGQVCLDKRTAIVNGILRGMRRRGLPGNVDVDDLQQEGVVAVFLSGIEGPESLVKRIARNSMLDFLRRKLRENKTFTAIDDSPDMDARKTWKDPFFFSAVDALRQGHEEWSRERAERWA